MRRWEFAINTTPLMLRCEAGRPSLEARTGGRRRDLRHRPHGEPLEPRNPLPPDPEPVRHRLELPAVVDGERLEGRGRRPARRRPMDVAERRIEPQARRRGAVPEEMLQLL